MTIPHTPTVPRPGRVPLDRTLLALPLLAFAGCTDRTGELPDPVPLDVPAPVGAAEPNVAVWGDRLIVSWIEPGMDAGATTEPVAPPPSGSGGVASHAPAGVSAPSTNGHAPSAAGRSRPLAHALRFAVWDGNGWSETRTIARGSGWFVNWADFPSVLALDDRTLVAHWLQRSAAASYAYDVMLTRSTDGGTTWSEPVRPHRDGTASEHGFVSFLPAGAGAGVVWLDGRRFAGPDATKEMTVRFTTLGADGVLGDEALLDERACDCCQTAAALTADGPLVAYRDRTPDEIRDIAVTRLVGGRWTPPRPLHDDGWRINGCPVNGPQADANGRDVVVAWYTGADDEPRVQAAFSGDAGATFGAPVRVDDGAPLGRVDVVLTDRGDALVAWLERADESAELRVRLIGGHTRGPARIIATTGAQRASGFPRMARLRGRVLLAWTDPADGSSVRAATLELPR
jgi:hypothetical protein